MGWLTHLFFAVTGARNEAGWVYGAWSGFGGAIPDIMIAVAIIGWLHHKNCHQHRCWRLGRHKVGDTGIVTCRRHHPVLRQHDRLTADRIRDLHRPPGKLVHPR